MDIDLSYKGSCESFEVARDVWFFELFWYILIRNFVEISACVLNFEKYVGSAVSLLVIFLPNILFALGIPAPDKVNFCTYPVVVNLSTFSIIALLLYFCVTSSSVILSCVGGEG